MSGLGKGMRHGLSTAENGLFINKKNPKQPQKLPRGGKTQLATRQGLASQDKAGQGRAGQGRKHPVYIRT